ncbi:wax ester/triacylglycerol synthase domain-containing protein [Mycolicibacterium sp. CBMA 226]|uniref:wax ester/triacylglycerol synthase domain-containing protein n=1 Tax=Mycolicibacterium sp. CBMA 226 TaxID=2606611 RepID=UPI001FB7625B|nr:wax ester/triacylglycerol synthase domain-containing protein [Mycolicibacterium sp. CBMA 226]
MTIRKLTSLDAQFLAMEDGRTHGHVSVLSTYAPSTADGCRLTAEVIRDLVAERLPLLPPFRWRLVRVPFDIDHPYWDDSGDIDLAHHVQESALVAPGDDRSLAEHVAELIARPLDRSLPLWEIHVIDGLAEGSVALLIKMHHAAVDGVSGADVLRVLLDDTAEGRVVEQPVAPERRRKPSQVELLCRGLFNASQYPVRSIRAALRALPHLDEVPTLRGVPGVNTVARQSRNAKAFLGQDDAGESTELVAPRTRFQSPISQHRSVAFGSVSLTEVKAVKERFGCSINDVVMAMCAAGLRTWLTEHDELPDGPMLSFVPVSVRTPNRPARSATGSR